MRVEGIEEAFMQLKYLTKQKKLNLEISHPNGSLYTEVER